MVANDTVRNLLFRNRGDGTFEEIGIFEGVAYDRNGKATGAMGIDVGTIPQRCETGIAVGNFANEMARCSSPPTASRPSSTRRCSRAWARRRASR